jgi:hypothetical protein
MLEARRRLPFVLAAGVLLATSCGARTGFDGLDGTSASGADGGDSGRDSKAGVDAAVACTPGSFTLDRADPAVMLVLDRSRSMAASFSSNGDSRWEVLTNALAASLPPVDNTMAIGALAYPDSASTATCAVAGAPDLSPGLGQAAAVVSLMRTKGTGGATPTADAIDVGGNALLAVRAASTARTIVLATDGGPDCNAALDPSTCRCVSGTSCNSAERCLDDARTVTRIASFATQGVPSFVIGIASAGDSTNADVLDAMAVAGGRPQTGAAHRYYAATSASELEAALVAIRDQVGACTYLTRSVPNAAGTITVTLGGEVVPYDPSGTSGWKWAAQSNGEIVFLGDLCARVAQSGELPVVEVSCVPPRDAGRSDAADGDASDGNDAAVEGSADAEVP